MRALRPFAVLVLVLALGASGAAVASPAPRPAGLPEAKPSALRVHSLLARLETLLASVWSKAGCRMDPWGQCEPAAPATDAGCGIDPLGRCGSNQ